MTSLLLDPQLAPTDALREVEGLPSLRVLTSGPLPPNPAEVLGSQGMKRLIAALHADADLVIIDSPPILLVTDAAIVSAGAAGTLLVMDSGTTRTDAARKAIAMLAKAGITPLGAVVNKLDRARSGGYYHYPYYGFRGGNADFYGSDGGDDTPGDQAQGGGAEAQSSRKSGRADRSNDARARGGWRRRLGDALTSMMG
jgi:Mrp family chromosome partitioning ATPase